MIDSRIPLLILGDSPSGHTGLGRILRDLAGLIHRELGDIFDVATLGAGAPPNSDLPFRQYPASRITEWMVHDLPLAWEAHTKGRNGILFCIWDISRLLWLAFPEQCPDEFLKDFLLNRFHGQKWVYPAVDAAGPKGKLPSLLQEALTKFDRVVNYSQFSARITGYPDVIPHGIDTKVFFDRGRASARTHLKDIGIDIEPEEHLIGIVATNQPRKDWALAFGVLASLKSQGIKARVWIHTDIDARHWDLKSLYVDFSLQPDITIFMTPYGIPDEELAVMYSACDVTMGIGPEGFGYPIAESLCCGVPCVTGRYGGQSDFVPKHLLVEHKAFRNEGIFAIERPVYDPVHFAIKVMLVLRDSGLTGGYRHVSPVCSWRDVWPQWRAWILKGVEQ